MNPQLVALARFSFHTTPLHPPSPGNPGRKTDMRSSRHTHKHAHTQTRARAHTQARTHSLTHKQGPESRFTFTAPDELVPWTGNQTPPRDARPAQEREVRSGGEQEAGEGGRFSGQAGALLRYCHLYQSGELTALCQEVQGLEVEEEYWDTSNCCVALRRV